MYSRLRSSPILYRLNKLIKEDADLRAIINADPKVHLIQLELGDVIFELYQETRTAESDALRRKFLSLPAMPATASRWGGVLKHDDVDKVLAPSGAVIYRPRHAVQVRRNAKRFRDRVRDIVDAYQAGEDIPP